MDERQPSNRRRTAQRWLAALGGGLICAACGSGTWEGGVHAKMGWSPEGLRVIEVPEGPAMEAGLRVDDRIVAIDEKPLDGLSQDEVHALLRGPVGFPVMLDLRRNGQPVRVEVDRAPYR